MKQRAIATLPDAEEKGRVGVEGRRRIGRHCDLRRDEVSPRALDGPDRIAVP